MLKRTMIRLGRYSVYVVVVLVGLLSIIAVDELLGFNIRDIGRNAVAVHLLVYVVWGFIFFRIGKWASVLS